MLVVAFDPLLCLSGKVFDLQQYLGQRRRINGSFVRSHGLRSHTRVLEATTNSIAGC